MIAEVEGVRRVAAVIAVNPDANWHHGFGSLLSPLACAISAHVQLISCARPCRIIKIAHRRRTRNLSVPEQEAYRSCCQANAQAHLDPVECCTGISDRFSRAYRPKRQSL